MYAQVVLNRPTHYRPPAGSDPLPEDRSWMATYTYRLPEHLRDIVRIGHLVRAPLQASSALGVIVGLSDTLPPDIPPNVAIRDLAEILDPIPLVTPSQIALAQHIASAYLAPLNQAMRLMLPPGLEARTFIIVSQLDKTLPSTFSPEERNALSLLRSRGGRMRLSALLEQMEADDPEAIIADLADRSLVDARYTLVPPKPAPARVQYVRLLADDETIDETLPNLGRSSKQADVLLILYRHASELLTLSELCLLAGCTEGPVRALAKHGWIEITERRTLLTAVPGKPIAEIDSMARAPSQVAALTALRERGRPVETNEFLTETGVSPGVISALVSKDLIRRIVEEPVVLLNLAQEQILPRIFALRGAEKQCSVLDALRGTTDRVWVGGIYAQTGASLSTLRDLADHGLISLHADEYDRPQLTGPEAPPTLSPAQAKVWAQIQAGLPGQSVEEAAARPEPFVALLHGVTGSGKTEIYLRALEATLAAGRRAIVLVPEISLTAQTVRRFETRFPGRVAVIHSQLSMGQRYAVWDRVRRGEADVVIGPRSALFAPVSRLGLIVLDEAHDDSYKQSDPIPLPSYHARDVAVALGQIAGATVLLGSATPDIGTYRRAAQGTYHLLELPHRIESLKTIGSHAGVPGISPGGNRPLPVVRIVDLRQELKAGNRSIFSRPLQEALRHTLEAGEQAILFLNRRGSATFVLCRDCGYVVRCPRCEIPLTLHRTSSTIAAPASRKLICHHCDHQEPSPTHCPACRGQRIRFFGLGTERVEFEMRQIYPQARLLRWDSDTASGTDHERYLQIFMDHRADVLIGTQMIAKGLDLPLVTLVGVISADTSLYLPDYRAAERTFQVLTQVAGRAGRSHRGGRVIVQTYNPDHYAIQSASQHDYERFYDQELAQRRRIQYPPFCRLIALRYSDKDLNRCRAESKRMGRWLSAEIHRSGIRAHLIGPAPCFFGRIQGRHRWQIIIRAQDPTSLLRNVALPQGWRVDVDPVNTL